MPPSVDSSSETTGRSPGSPAEPDEGDGRARSEGKPDWRIGPKGTAVEWSNRKAQAGTHFKLHRCEGQRDGAPRCRSAPGRCRRCCGTELMSHRRVFPHGAGTIREFVGDIDGQKVQSVAGGGHWGGACSSTPTTWTVGYLFLRNGTCRRSIGRRSGSRGP